MKKRNADLTPTAKVTAGAVGSALASIVVFVAVKAGLDVSAEESVALTGSLATVIGFGLAYFTGE